MRKRLCAVVVAAAVMAAVPAVYVVGGTSAEASTGPTVARQVGPDPTPADAAVSGVGTGDAAAASAATAGSSHAGAVARAKAVPAPTTHAATGTGAAGGGGGSVLTGALRDLAARRGIAVGSSVLTSSNITDSQYSTVLAREYDMVTPETDMKFAATEPGPGVFDFAPGDLIVSFAKSHDMAVRGHNLAWWANNPTWLTSVPYTRDQLIGILHDHITAVVGHYRGQVTQWDVVNEGLSGGFWWDHIGPEYIDMAFRWAHDADPGAKLFYNETGAEGLGAKSDAVYDLVRGLRQRGVPIDGVGLESHFDLNPPPLGDIAANMRRLNALGLQTAITEFDVRIPVPASAPDLDRQRTIYNGLLATCVAAANCKTFVTWGFTDKVSWVSGAYPGYGAALPFDQNYAAKPAYYGLRAALGG
jgi:endo-1,4-beta-xylanase